MANFPTSVWAPASKTAGQVIQPAHINDLQDEVVAIEAGLRNGTAPLNSSNSTFTEIRCSSLYVNGVSLTAQPDAVRAALTTTQDIASSASVVIRGLTTQNFITNSSMHSIASNSSRVTPQSTGLYMCRGQIKFTANSTGWRGIAILDSSGAEIGENRIDAVATAETVLQASGIKRFDALGGYVRMTSRQSGASTLSAEGGGPTWLEVVKL